MQKEWLSRSGSQWLMSNPDLYSVDSEVVPRLHYAAEGSEFLVIRDRDMYRMDLHEAAEWIRKCIIPEMAEEMKEIVDDIIENNRGELIYGKKMQVPHNRRETGGTIQVQGSILRDFERGLLQMGNM